MKRYSIKKSLAIILSLVMVLSLISAYNLNVFASFGASTIGPRAVSGMKFEADSLKVDGGELVTFTATFTDTQSKPEPVSISTKNGGIIKIETEDDVVFHVAGTKADITDLNINEDQNEATFNTPEIIARKQNSFTFQVEAPLNEESFEVTVHIGTGTMKKIIAVEVIPGLTIEAPEEADDMTPFKITGNAKYKGKQPPEPTYIFAEIINKDTGEPMDEIQYTSEIIDMRYSFGPLTLPSTYDDAIYEIRVYMMHDDLYILGSATKDIKYVKVDKTEILTLKPDRNIYADTREVTIKTVDKDNQGIPFTSVNLSVSKDTAILSHSWVSTDSNGEAKITVTDTEDEYIILTAETTGGKKVTIPIDFREIPNLGFNQIVTVSDVLQENQIEYDGEKLIDGLHETRWSSAKDTSWVEIDFGESRAFNKVTFEAESQADESAYKYVIEYFENGQWNLACEGAYDRDGGESIFPRVIGSKFRVSFTGKKASIYELSIFNTDDYIITVRDIVEHKTQNGTILNTTKTTRTIPYTKGDSVGIDAIGSYTFDRIVIPADVVELKIGNGNKIVGNMPARDVEVYFYYTTIVDNKDIIEINVLEKDGEKYLTDQVEAFNYIWVANSSKGTIVKIKTDTGEIVGEYKSSPNGQPANPSRTTVDKDGNVWVTNRDGNSVVKIGLAEAGEGVGWIDKNGNGVCDTSVGLGDVRSWTNTGNLDTNGGVLTAEDECVLLYVRTSSTGTRHLSIDEDNNVWVSGTGSRVFDLINSKTGKIIKSEGPVGFGGYGGLIDKNGVIWSSNPLLRWDTKKPLSGANGVNYTGIANTNGSSYGLAIDSKGNVWNSINGGDGKIRKYSPSGALIGAYNQGDVAAQGCVVGKNDDVWVAHSLNKTTVGHLKNDGTYVGTIVVSSGASSGPTGVAVDDKGFIWVTCYNGRVVKIDPEKGPLGADGKTKVGEIVYTSPDLGGLLYNYSDMTGSTLIGSADTGTWEFINDSGQPNTYWNKVNWESKNETSDTLQVFLSTSHDKVTFSKPVRVYSNTAFKIPNGQYIKVTVRLNRPASGISPRISRLFVSSIPY